MTKFAIVPVEASEEMLLELDDDPKWIRNPAHEPDKQNTRNVLEALGLGVADE